PAEQLRLPSRLQPGDRPRHREALKQELDRPLPGVLLVPPPVERLRVLTATGGRQGSAQDQNVALGVAVLARRRGRQCHTLLLALSPAATHGGGYAGA